VDPKHLVRIWTRGSVFCTTDFFVSGWQDANKKEVLFFNVFFLITFWRYISISFIDKKSKRSHKMVEIKIFLFLTFLAFWWNGPDPDPGDPKTYEGSTNMVFIVLLWLTAIRTVLEEKCFFWFDGFDFLGDVNTVLFKADITQLKSEVKKELASLKKLQKVCYR